MGMAASQARFLGITARKTNTEYEGQQVNQQRTALANQSANLYNQLLGLNVPTPPSKSDSKYTKTVYTFTDDTGATATINSITNNPDSATSAQWPQVVSYTTSQQTTKSRRSSLATAAATSTKNTDNDLYKNYIKVGSADPAQVSKITIDPDYNKDKTAKNNIYSSIYQEQITAGATEEVAKTAASAGTNNLYKYTKADGSYSYVNLTEFTGTEIEAYEYEADGTKSATASKVKRSGTGTEADPYVYKIGDNVLETVDTAKIQLSGTASSDATALGDVDYSNITKLQETYASLQGQDTFYKYTISGVNYYIPATDVNDGFNTGNFNINPSTESSDPYGYYVATESENVNKEYPAKVTYDTSGRLQSVILKEGEDSLSFNVNVNSVTDEDKYENDFNQYKYEYAQYEKTVEDINAQTEAIQAQDRTLELRLKQLDTEQEALTQEMDAIKKVIDKNVETTFKTFA